MTAQLAAILGLIGLAVFLVGDIFLASDKIKGNTWSELLRFWSMKNVFVAWVWGGLSGHFFHWWATGKTTWQHTAVLVWISLGVALGGALLEHFVGGTPTWVFPLVLTAAYITWAFLWPV